MKIPTPNGTKVCNRTPESCSARESLHELEKKAHVHEPFRGSGYNTFHASLNPTLGR